MAVELSTLDAAIRCIDSEQTIIRSEAEAYRTFRDTVGHARPTGSNGGDPTSLAAIAEQYRETVLSTPAYQETYGASLADCLEAEFPPSSASALQSNDDLTQRLKRDLLLAATRAVDQRDEFDDLLDHERQTLESIQADLRDINASLDELPPCTLARLSFTEYTEVWNTTNAILDQCDDLLRDRQTALSATNRPIRPGSDNPYDLAEYLYHELPTSYPALSAIAATRQQVQHHRKPIDSGDARDTDAHMDAAPASPTTLNETGD